MKRAKMWLGLLVTVYLGTLWAQEVWADTATVDGIDWQYRNDGGRITIISDSYNTNYSSTYYKPAISPWTTGAITIPSKFSVYWVTSIGKEAFYGCSRLTSVTIPDSVTDIGSYAFYECSGLTNITIPDSLMSIGSYAFEDCSSLTSLTIPASVTNIEYSAFNGCSSINAFSVAEGNQNYMALSNLLLTKDGKRLIGGVNGAVVIPNSVTSIGGSAFYRCSNLTSVTIPDSVTSIGSSAFYFCTNLTSVTIPDSVTSIGRGVFSRCSGLTNVTISDNVTRVEDYTFSECSALTSVTIPDSVTSIGYEAFSYCSSLTNVTIGNNVMNIGDRAFHNCRSLTSMTIPDSVTTIGTNAFSGCSGLKSVTIPQSVCKQRLSWVFPDAYQSITNVVIGANVKSFESVAFSGCKSLESFSVDEGNPVYKAESGLLLTKDGKTLVNGVNGYVRIPDHVTAIGAYAFYGYSGLTSVIIPDSVTDIGNSAFYQYGSLVSMTIGNGVTNIGRYAFLGCSNLMSVAIGNNVTRIGDGAFWSCHGLTSVTIPDSVTSIGNNAFFGCRNLASVTIPASVVSIGSDVFDACSNLKKVYVPESWKGTVSLTLPTGCQLVYVKAYLELAESSRTFQADAASGEEARVTANVPWTATSAASWLTVKTESGMGNGTIVFDVAANTNTESRTATITVESGNLTRLFTVTQTRWKYTVQDSMATVTGAASAVGELIIPAMLDGYPVKAIGSSAFSGCSGLTGLRISSGVTSLGDDAFRGCSGLTSVTIPNSVTSIGTNAFSGCSGLTSVTIPQYVCGQELSNVFPSSYQCITNIAIGAAVTNIGSSAFSGCSGLASVTMPASVTCIGSYAFYGCQSLTNMTIPPNVTSIGEYAFYDCQALKSVTIPDSVASIDDYAFYGCQSLTNILIPASVTRIGEYALYGCQALASVTIPPSVTRIGAYAFYGWQSLTNMTIPADVTSIGEYAFYDCQALKSVTIPDSVTSIGNNAFGQYSNLVSVVIGNGVTDIGWLAGNTLLEEVLIGDGVTKIDAGLFAGCGHLRTLHIGDGVTDIGDFAFAGCSNLVSVVIGNGIRDIGWLVGNLRLEEVFIGDGVREIGASLFARCSQLKTLRLGNGVETIGADAFNGCRELSVLSIPDSVTSIGSNAFEGCTNLMTVAIGNGVKDIDWLLGKTNLERVTIGSGVKVIGTGPFAGCSKLMSLTLSEGLECIVDDAFASCGALEWVELPSTLVDWGMRSLPPRMQEKLAGEGDGFIVVNGWVLGYGNTNASALTIPAGVVGIGNHALANFWELQKVEMPDSLKYIGQGAFETNTYLDNVVIPDGVEWIRDGAFQVCTYLRDLTIGENVEHIGREAFRKCTQLAAVNVPDSVVEVGDGAFAGCWRLLSVRLPLGLEAAGTGMFTGCTNLVGVTMPSHGFTAERLFGERAAKLKSVTVAEGETAVCSNAFKGGLELADVSLPGSLRDIGAGAFANCQSLVGLELPEGLERIGAGAFEGCKALEAIVLPGTVTEVGTGVFRDCLRLEDVTLSKELGQLPDYAFAGCKRLWSVMVPASVTNLGRGLGEWLTGVYFLGNAPAYHAAAYTPRSTNVTTYVVQGTRGWDGIPSSRDLPESWLAWPITFWAPNRFDATFDANGGTFPPNGAATYACEQITGVAYALPPFDPVLEGADFDGWWTDPAEGARITSRTKVNETREITFYAHWKGAPEVTVRFNPNGGTVEPAERKYQAMRPYGELPVPTREYFLFAGWWTAPENGDRVVPGSRVPVSDQELYAHWTPETYYIRYHANGGEGTMADQPFQYGKWVVLWPNEFRWPGREFAGWALEPDGEAVFADAVEFARAIAAIQNGIIHLYAVWSDGKYAVRFDSNGGTNQMDNQTFYLGVPQAISPCEFKRDGFRFVGWGLIPGGTAVFADGERVKDLTTVVNATVVLYAIWEKVDGGNLPVIERDSEVAGALAGAADGRMGEKIRTVSEYEAFREWALGVKGRDGTLAGPSGVMASAHAWPSYLLGAEKLLANEPDIRLAGFEMGGAGAGTTSRGGAAATLTLRVRVLDGDDMARVDADKVGKLVAATGDLCNWAGESKPSLRVQSAETEGDGTLAFRVSVGDAADGRAFLGIRE